MNIQRFLIVEETGSAFNGLGGAVSLRVATFNANGMSSKFFAIKSLLFSQKVDILLVQETWLFNLNKFSVSGYNVIHISAMDSDRPLVGRPFGGIAIYIRDDIKFEQISPLKKPEQVDIDTYARVLAINLTDFDVLLTNFYLPSVDTNLSCAENNDKLIKSLSYWKSFSEGFSTKISIGDFNTNPMNKNLRQSSLELFFEDHLDLDLRYLRDNRVDLNSQYTFSSSQHSGSTSFIDRVLATDDIMDSYEIHNKNDLLL